MPVIAFVAVVLASFLYFLVRIHISTVQKRYINNLIDEKRFEEAEGAIAKYMQLKWRLLFLRNSNFFLYQKLAIDALKLDNKSFEAAAKLDN